MANERFMHGSWTADARWLAGGSMLASAGHDGVVRCWTRAGEPVRAFDTPSYNSCCTTPAGTLVAGFNGDDGSIRIWDVTSGDVVARLPGHRTAVPAHRTGANTSSACFSPDGRVLASGGFDDGVRLWDVATGELRATLDVGDMTWSLAFSDDGTRLACGALKGRLSVWSVEELAPVASATVSKGAVTSVVFGRDGDVFAGGGKGELVRHRLLGAKLTKQATFVTGDRGGVEGLAISPDGARLAAASRAGWMRVFDVASGLPMERSSLTGGFFLDAAFAPDGTALAVAGPSPFLLVDFSD